MEKTKSEKLDEIFKESELVYQVEKYFDKNTVNQMINELKEKINKDLLGN